MVSLHVLVDEATVCLNSLLVGEDRFFANQAECSAVYAPSILEILCEPSECCQDHGGRYSGCSQQSTSLFSGTSD